MTNGTEYQRGYREGAEKMREDAARKASESCLAPPDGGSPTPDEVAVSDRAAASIRALPITPPQPEAQVDVRKAFEEWHSNKFDHDIPSNRTEHGYFAGTLQIRWQAWKAVWKEKSK